jgi:hypothetical protein
MVLIISLLLLIIWLIGAIFTISLAAVLDDRGHEVPGPIPTFLLWPMVLGDIIGQHIASAYEDPEEKEKPKE